jgi:hypothetical protein
VLVLLLAAACCGGKLKPEEVRKAVVKEAVRHGISPCPLVGDHWELCL